MLFLAVDNGPDRFLCAGPVLSHYEFEVTGPPRRLSDTDWKYGRSGFLPGTDSWPAVLDGGLPPDLTRDRIEGVSPPVWTRAYLVPQR